MGTTASGLRYPEPTEPVAQGAVNIRNLAEDVTALYPGKAALGLAMQPAGAAAGALPVRYAAGLATLSFTAGNATFTVPNGGKAWTQMFFVAIMTAGAGTGGIAGNQFVTSAAGTVGIFYVTGYSASGVIMGTGAVNVHYFAIGQ